LTKELSNLKKKLKSAERGLTEMNRASSYKEKADLLMANMWQIDKGTNEVKLPSFDGEKEVVIKLQEMLTPQANAERYYKKGKNESKQRVYAQKHLDKIIQEIADKEKEIADFSDLESLKEIRKVTESKGSQQQARVPYRSTTIDGYEIRIGKGAKDNDELLRSYTTKFDLWLHAKDVSGSHVIIRNPSKKDIALSTIEKVASIAAFYSKAKSESLAAVIYTDRKYIRKPKGATPGLVKVDKEKMLLVEPSGI
jgi:predicted ribosome quality control (RQC) complex YloA/Tae2 family protein